MGEVMGWLVTIETETTGFDDRQLQRLSDGLGSGGGGFYHNMTPRLTIGKLVRLADVREAATAGMDTILSAFAASGIEGEVKKLEVSVSDPEATDEAIRRAFREMFVGTSEIATMLGVSRQRVSELARTHADFPEPLERLAAGPVYAKDEVEVFERGWERKRTGRPRKNAS